MLDVGPLEFFVLRNESHETHPAQFLPIFAFHHFHRLFPLNPFNISIDAFASHIAVESLGGVGINAVPALRVAFLQFLQNGNLLEIGLSENLLCRKTSQHTCTMMYCFIKLKDILLFKCQRCALT